MNRRVLLALATVTPVMSASAAYAGGFLADTLVKSFDPGLAQKLDAAHAAAGKPLDHAANAAAGTATTAATGNPAAGAAVTGVLEVRTNPQ